MKYRKARICAECGWAMVSSGPARFHDLHLASVEVCQACGSMNLLWGTAKVSWSIKGRKITPAKIGSGKTERDFIFGSGKLSLCGNEND